MSNKDVHIHPPQRQLKEKLDSASPRTIDEDLWSAAANLKEIRSRCADDVEASINRLVEALKLTTENASKDNIEALYECSARMIGAASVIQVNDIVSLAIKLCDLIDHQLTQSKLDLKPIAVLVDTIHFLYNNRQVKVDVGSLLSGVGDMLKHVEENQASAKTSDRSSSAA